MIRGNCSSSQKKLRPDPSDSAQARVLEIFVTMKTIYLSTSALLVVCSMLLGCGGGSSTNCDPTGISVFPNNVTITIPSGNNAQQFGTTVVVPAGCTPPTESPSSFTWTTSDPVDVPITSTGIATCVNKTPSNVIVTATLSGVTETGVNGTVSITGTASITCQ
jgi:hypothetical protein